MKLTLPTSEQVIAGGHNTWFQRVLHREVDALQQLADRMRGCEQSISAACILLSDCRTESGGGRRVVVGGVGKAGLIGRKVAATLCSTGTPAIFVHPVEALHGDLGGICRGDCGLLFSYSGTTPEVVRLASELRRLDCQIISVTRTDASELGRISDVVLELGELSEACGLGLAPSSTTTAMLAVGDALALAIAKVSGFSEGDFARNHPAGMLGLRFRPVAEFMRTDSRLVCVTPSTKISEVVRQVSVAKTGAAILVEEDQTLAGIFTDGDLRRALLSGGEILSQPVRCHASVPCAAVNLQANTADAWREMLDRRIEDLPVVDNATRRVVGLLCLKDIQW